MSLSRVIAELNRCTMGWVNYFSLAAIKSLTRDLDSWIQRRLRCFLWKQWKHYRTRVRHLQGAGVGPWLAYGVASGKHGPWAVSGCPAMTRAIPNAYLKKQGYQSLHERYLALASN